jgi:hypothetical protein
MKKIYGTITMLMMATVILTACGALLDPPGASRDGETGTVHIAIDGAAGARTLTPAAAAFTRYTASFSGPDTQADVTLSGGSGTVDLVTGSWTITVTASTGTDPTYTEVGRGSATVTVTRLQPVTADIAIIPLTGGGKTGGFSWSATIPAVDTATLTLADSTGAAVGGMPVDLKATADASTGIASGTLGSLDAGYYLMNIRLEKDSKSAGRTEVVHIYDGLATSANYVFTDYDFEAIIDLSDGLWKDGEITTKDEKQYYRFPVASGTSYVLWWNQKAEGQYLEISGDGTKTLATIFVSAYNESDNAKTDFFGAATQGPGVGYRNPKIFIANVNGNVIVEVKAATNTDTGTYAVRYHEVRPLAINTPAADSLAAGEMRFYAFSRSARTAYTISWEDSGDQATASSYTGDVTVTAWDINIAANLGANISESGAFSAGDGYTEPRVVTSGTSSLATRRILLKVEAETEGNYSIKYQQ